MRFGPASEYIPNWIYIKSSIEIFFFCWKKHLFSSILQAFPLFTTHFLFHFRSFSKIRKKISIKIVTFCQKQAQITLLNSIEVYVMHSRFLNATSTEDAVCLRTVRENLNREKLLRLIVVFILCSFSFAPFQALVSKLIHIYSAPLSRTLVHQGKNNARSRVLTDCSLDLSLVHRTIRLSMCILSPRFYITWIYHLINFITFYFVRVLYRSLLSFSRSVIPSLRIHYTAIGCCCCVCDCHVAFVVYFTRQPPLFSRVRGTYFTRKTSTK